MHLEVCTHQLTGGGGRMVLIPTTSKKLGLFKCSCSTLHPPPHIGNNDQFHAGSLFACHCTLLQAHCPVSFSARVPGSAAIFFSRPDGVVFFPSWLAFFGLCNTELTDFQSLAPNFVFLYQNRVFEMSKLLKLLSFRWSQ